MAVSPRRVSKSRKGKKNSHSALKTPSLTICQSCSKYVKRHTICKCGFYKGQKVTEK